MLVKSRNEPPSGNKRVWLCIPPFLMTETDGQETINDAYVIVEVEGGVMQDRRFFKRNQFSAVKSIYSVLVADITGEPTAVERRRLFSAAGRNPHGA